MFSQQPYELRFLMGNTTHQIVRTAINNNDFDVAIRASVIENSSFDYTCALDYALEKAMEKRLFSVALLTTIAMKKKSEDDRVKIFFKIALKAAEAHNFVDAHSSLEQINQSTSQTKVVKCLECMSLQASKKSDKILKEIADILKNIYCSEVAGNND